MVKSYSASLHCSRHFTHWHYLNYISFRNYLPKIENNNIQKHFLSNALGRLLVCDIKATIGSDITIT